MKEYSSDQIRNVAVVSHDGAGKTALVESLLLTSGAVDFVGRGQDNKHIMDFEPEEIKRNVTIQLVWPLVNGMTIRLTLLIHRVTMNSMAKFVPHCVLVMAC